MTRFYSKPQWTPSLSVQDDDDDDGSGDNDRVYDDDTNNDDDEESLFIGPLIGLPPGVHNGKEV